MSVELAIDKRAVRNSFGAAADSYDGVAALQRQVGEMLHANIDRPMLQRSRVLDVGCGTGFLTGKLSADCQQLLALDIALPMVGKTRAGLIDQTNIDYLCADAEALPLSTNSVDCIVSNLSLQWCQDLESVFNEFRRVLSAQGQLRFSTFGPNTLKELKTAWAKVDGYAHVNDFYQGEQLKRSLAQAGFKNIRVKTEMSVSNYSTVSDLMRELKGIGAHNVNQGRFRSLTGKTRMQKMIRNYEDFRYQSLIPATFEIIFVEAEAGTEGTAYP